MPSLDDAVGHGPSTIQPPLSGKSSGARDGESLISPYHVSDEGSLSAAFEKTMSTRVELGRLMTALATGTNWQLGVRAPTTATRWPPSQNPKTSRSSPKQLLERSPSTSAK